MQTVAGSKDVAEMVFLLIGLKLLFGGQSFCVKLKSSDQKNEKYFIWMKRGSTKVIPKQKYGLMKVKKVQDKNW
jgi:hypothetical protein